MQSSIPVLSIFRASGSGKTTLIENMVPDLKTLGLHIATIKHHAHPGFDIDITGKDTWRDAQASSDMVIIPPPDKTAIIVKLEEEQSPDEIIEEIKG